MHVEGRIGPVRHGPQDGISIFRIDVVVDGNHVFACCTVENRGAIESTPQLGRLDIALDHERNHLADVGQRLMPLIPSVSRRKLRNSGSMPMRLIRLDSLGVTCEMIEVRMASRRRVMQVTSIYALNSSRSTVLALTTLIGEPTSAPAT